MTSKKYDAGKADLSILSYSALEQIAKAFEFGANKYGRYNYLETGFRWTRLCSSTLRHAYAFAWGEDNDPESGLPHPAHIAANAIMLLDHLNYNIGIDDRYEGNK